MIFGSISDARQVLRRFLAGGATVTMVVDGPLPPQTDRVSTVRYATRPAADDTAGILRLIGPAWLVVTCGDRGPLRDRVAELAGHLHVLMIDEEPAAERGQVTLVGGGPGRTQPVDARGGPGAEPRGRDLLRPAGPDRPTWRRSLRAPSWSTSASLRTTTRWASGASRSR